MAKATKKTVKKTVKKSSMPTMSMPMSEMSMDNSTMMMPAAKPMNNKVISYALVVVALALLAYKVGPWLVPTIVDNRPITRFALWSRLEKNYGTQALDDMVNEKILDSAIAKAGVKVDQSKVDAQVKSLETQFESTGGLDEALKQRGLSRKELIKQVTTQLAVETLLADKINPTDEEVKKQYDDNMKTLYKDKKFDEVKASITDELKQTKLRDAFLTWFADVKKDAKVKSFGL